MSKVEVGILISFNVALTIPARMIIGALVDRFGPRKPYSAPNLEGRVVLHKGQRSRLGETKHDWEILCDLADALGSKQYSS